MSSLTRVDPDTGRAFFRDADRFVCMLLPPQRGPRKRAALLAFAFSGGTSSDALELARHASDRHYAMVLDRIALGGDAWPESEPGPAQDWLVERGGFVVLAPSVEAWVAMPPARPHHLVQIIATTPADDETTARAALAQLGTCGVVARVRAVVDCGSGAEIDAVVCDGQGLRAGWFASKASDDGTLSPAHAESTPRAEPESLRAAATLALDPTITDRDSLLNAALAAYLAPRPDTRRLEALLRAQGFAVELPAIRGSLDEVVSATTDRLWSEQPGVTWTEAFERQLFEQLSSRAPWLSPRGFASVLSYAKWLCWHEGLST